MKILPINSNYRNYFNSTNYNLQKVSSPVGCDSVHFRGTKSEATKKVIILLGAPNSGKGTFARQISQNFNIPQISTGDILRKELKSMTELGQKAKAYMDSGNLVPDELIMDIFKNRIAQPDCKAGFILDGFPRTINQAEQLDKLLAEDKKISLKIVNLDVDKPILYARSASRYTCEDCSRVYSIKEGYNPETAKCDCGGKLIKRADDTPEVLTQRLEHYNKQTLPLLDYYGEKVSNIGVHGKDAPVNETLSRIMDKIL
jgi:adenylate kinase